MPGPDPSEHLVEVQRTVVADGESVAGVDALAREEPLELRIGGVPVAVVMRTPGHDEELALGFLLTEGIARPEQVRHVRHCDQVDDPRAEDNVLQIVLEPGVEVDLARLRRNLYATSSCGICGKASIEAALRRVPPLRSPEQCATRIAMETLYTLPGRLREAQPVFDRTGGLHAAALFDGRGEPLVIREDVGRHNAVDKVVGRAARDGLGLESSVLMVSGKVSYEIVQKALAARLGVIAAVSAPSSLAVELAREANMTLVAFLRGRRMSVYSGEARLDGVLAQAAAR